jgi:hypothetical protein
LSFVVLWAQRSSSSDASKNIIYLTIVASDIPKSDLKLTFTPTSLKFSGPSQTKGTTYHVELELFEEIDDKNVKVNHSPRDIEMVLTKKELKEEYWPRLLKEKRKVHFLKTDFDKVRLMLLPRKTLLTQTSTLKWVDEDEQDAIPEDEMGGGGGMGGMPDMGDMGGMGGMGGMGDMGGMGGMGGIDFSKLGAGGMGGMPDIDMGDEEEEGEEDDVSLQLVSRILKQKLI